MYALFCRPFTKHLKPIFVVDSRLSASQVVLVVKNLPVNAGDIKDASSVPGLGRFPGEGNGNPLQYSYLENPTDRGTQRATVQGIESDTTEVTEQTRLSVILSLLSIVGPVAMMPMFTQYLT